MFTGIVEETSEILDVTADEDGRQLRIATGFGELERGASISVSGACLTVEAGGDGWFEVFLSSETLDRTYLGELSARDQVNIERALSADARLDGHFVQGHVDGTAEVVDSRRIGDDWEFVFSLPSALDGYVVEKGSIAVDGISLTVADLDDERFSVAIIPETHEATALSEKTPGDPVHLEVDVVAKYVESLVDGYADAG